MFKLRYLNHVHILGRSINREQFIRVQKIKTNRDLVLKVKLPRRSKVFVYLTEEEKVFIHCRHKKERSIFRNFNIHYFRKTVVKLRIFLVINSYIQFPLFAATHEIKNVFIGIYCINRCQMVAWRVYLPYIFYLFAERIYNEHFPILNR
jgi:hypothetical protein